VKGRKHPVVKGRKHPVVKGRKHDSLKKPGLRERSVRSPHSCIRMSTGS